MNGVNTRNRSNRCRQQWVRNACKTLEKFVTWFAVLLFDVCVILRIEKRERIRILLVAKICLQKRYCVASMRCTCFVSIQKSAMSVSKQQQKIQTKIYLCSCWETSDRTLGMVDRLGLKSNLAHPAFTMDTNSTYREIAVSVHVLWAFISRSARHFICLLIESFILPAIVSCVDRIILKKTGENNIINSRERTSRRAINTYSTYSFIEIYRRWKVMCYGTRDDYTQPGSFNIGFEFLVEN